MKRNDGSFATWAWVTNTCDLKLNMKRGYNTFVCHQQLLRERRTTRFSIGTIILLLKIKKQKLRSLLGQNNLEFIWSYTPCISNPDSPCLCHIWVMPICSVDRDQRKRNSLRGEMLAVVGGEREKENQDKEAWWPWRTMRKTEKLHLFSNSN